MKPEMTVTVLPPRCAVWRTIFTCPRGFFDAAGFESVWAGLLISSRSRGVGGSSIFCREAKGLAQGAGSPLVGMRVSFFIAVSSWHMLFRRSRCVTQMSLRHLSRSSIQCGPWSLPLSSKCVFLEWYIAAACWDAPVELTLGFPPVEDSSRSDYPTVRV